MKTRYFHQPDLGWQISATLQEPTDTEMGHFSNTHVLSDPDNFESAPVEGWEEVSEKRYNQLVEDQAARVEAKASTREETANADRRLAYEEALDLGFSSRAASAMSGHTPE